MSYLRFKGKGRKLS